jgi:DNA-binding NarL/FixJ family response regulator
MLSGARISTILPIRPSVVLVPRSDGSANGNVVVYFAASRIEQVRRMSKLRVLLADDHPALLEIVESMVEPEFEVVGKVADGKSLLETAKRLNPDVIVTDISMPNLNGIEAVKKLKESGSRAKAVFLTGHSDRDILRACLDAGAVGYVVKPRMTTDLLPALREALAGRIFFSRTLERSN